MVYAGFVVSVSLASAFIGCALSGTIADVVGRRRAFQISCVPMILGSIIRCIYSVIETCGLAAIVSTILLICSFKRILCFWEWLNIVPCIYFLIYIYFSPCSAVSTHVGAMILGRFIVGLGLGLSGPVTAMYVSEVKLVLWLFSTDFYPNPLHTCIFWNSPVCCRYRLHPYVARMVVSFRLPHVWVFLHR